MYRTLLVVALAIIAPSLYAQNSTSTDPSAPKSRSQVQSEIPKTGERSATGQIEHQNPPKVNSTKSRSQVKSEAPPYTGPQKTNAEPYHNPPKAQSSKSRQQVKSEIPPTGAPGTEQTEVQAPPKTNSSK